MEDRPGLGSFLSMAHVAAVSAKNLDIRFPARCSFQFAEVTKKANREFVEKTLARKAGKPLDLHITLEKAKKEDTSEAADKPSAVSRHMLPSLEDDIENEPIIKNVLEMFDGEVI